MTFDVIQWLTGDDARKAYEQDEPSNDGPPNDYWLRNASMRARSAEVDAQAHVELVRLKQDGSPDTSAGTVEELKQYVTDNTSVYWLGFKDGVINMVCEQYQR